MGANAHINGGSIVGFDCPDAPAREDCAAIHLLAAPGVRINGMSLNNNVIGIKTIGSTRNVDGARIHDNDITGNLRFGIGLFASAEGAQITGNDLSDTGGFPGGQGFGIVLASFGASVNGNIANNCARSGILLFGDEIDPPGQRNTVRDNTTLDNGRSGIVSLGGGGEEFRPRDNLIQSNTSFGNGVRDLGEVIGGPPPVFPADCLNTWRDNDFDVATQDCIE